MFDENKAIQKWTRIIEDIFKKYNSTQYLTNNDALHFVCVYAEHDTVLQNLNSNTTNLLPFKLSILAQIFNMYHFDMQKAKNLKRAEKNSNLISDFMIDIPVNLISHALLSEEKQRQESISVAEKALAKKAAEFIYAKLEKNIVWIYDLASKLEMSINGDNGHEVLFLRMRLYIEPIAVM